MKSVWIALALLPAVPAAAAEDKPYRVETAVPDVSEVGKAQAATVTLAPAEGWKTNKEFPTRLRATPPAGVRVERPEQKAADAREFSEKKAVFAIAYTPTAAGEHAIDVDFRFAVCTPKVCVPGREKIAIKIVAR